MQPRRIAERLAGDDVVARAAQHRDDLVVAGVGVVVEGLDATEAPSGHLDDRLQNGRLQQLRAIDGADRAADAITPVMAPQRALAPSVRHADQLDHRIELVEGLMGDKTDTIERHLGRLLRL